MPLRLFLDGWMFPADASLNLAAAQRPDLPYLPPRLEVETAGGWQVLVPAMGFPAGKTKTMVVDMPPLPAGRPPAAHRHLPLAGLGPHRLDPRKGGRRAPGPGPPQPAVGRAALPRLLGARPPFPQRPARLRLRPGEPESPWLPFAGHYTRYGDVRELLAATDDRSVVIGPGDEIALEFDAGGLPPSAPGWKRTVFLQSQGWDKDADRNTWEARRMEPLPFRAMQRYGDPLPDTPALRDYRENWLTRALPPYRSRNTGGAEQ